MSLPSASQCYVLYMRANLNGLDRNECDPGRTGSLDREAFVQGMWSIDGELAKAAKINARRQRG